jgi:Ca-activated chloride channel family protein
MGVILRYLQVPWLLAAAVVLPIVLATLALVWGRRREARVARLASPELIERIAPTAAGTRAGWRAARLGLAALLAGVALAGPRWGLQATAVRASGIDVVLSLDASLSMLATDERPNRLARLKQEVRRLRALAPGDRTALIAFAGRSYILTPLTTDDGALELFLDGLDPSVVGQAGSSLARTIRQATDLLTATKSGSDRAIVVMSDGEAFEPIEDVQEAARAAGEAGIALVTVGFGTPAGSTIPVRDGNTATVKRDEDGNIVVTRYNPETLRAAAEAAHGTFVPAEATDKAARVRVALARLRAQPRAVDVGRDLTPRFQLFLFPALLLILLDSWLAERGRRGRRRVRAPAATAPATTTAALLLVVLGGTSCVRRTGDDEALRLFQAGKYAEAAEVYRSRIQGPGTPRALYNYGTALVAWDSTASALDPLDRARRDPDAELRFRALFNLGLAHLKRGLAARGDSAATAPGAPRPVVPPGTPPGAAGGAEDDSTTAELDAALETYRRALLMRSGDMDAKWNYELALRKKKQQSGGGGGGGGGGNSSSSGSPPPEPPPEQQQNPAGGLGQRQAEELLNSAARDERETQGKRQRQNPPPPPGGKDW